MVLQEIYAKMTNYKMLIWPLRSRLNLGFRFPENPAMPDHVRTWLLQNDKNRLRQDLKKKGTKVKYNKDSLVRFNNSKDKYCFERANFSEKYRTDKIENLYKILGRAVCIVRCTYSSGANTSLA